MKNCTGKDFRFLDLNDQGLSGDLGIEVVYLDLGCNPPVEFSNISDPLPLRRPSPSRKLFHVFTERKL